MRYPLSLRSVHLALVLLCLGAWASAQFAGDYKRAFHPGFSVHEFVGIAFTVALATRVLMGILGSERARFSTWFPFTKRNLRLIAEDVRNFIHLQFAERFPHEGLAGLVQFLGLIAFVVIAATGSVMAFYLEPGNRATGWLHSVKELHEVAQFLIPVYLTLHVGGVLVHALSGHHLWREMVFMRKAAK